MTTDMTTSKASGAESKTRSAEKASRLAPAALLRVIGIMAAIALLFALLIVVGGKTSGVVTQAIVTGILLGGVYGLVSMGLTLIFGVLDIVNFAQGTFVTLAMFVAYVLVTGAGLGVYVATLVAVAALFVVGYLVQSVLLNRMMAAGRIENQLLVTLGVSLFVANLLLLVFGGQPKSINGPFNQALHVFGAVASVPRLIAFCGAIVLAVGLYLTLQRTRLGTAIRAVAANAEGASLVGVNVRRVYSLTFAIGTACVGAAGGLILPFLSLTPSTGEQFTILAFVIVVLGGLGHVGGALVGGFVIGLVQEIGALYLTGTGSLLVVFAVFILVLCFRPQGLLGGRS
jgi:branched-chain amino acid transport system permease protein